MPNLAVKGKQIVGANGNVVGKGVTKMKAGLYNAVLCRIDVVYFFERCSTCCCKGGKAMRYGSSAALTHVRYPKKAKWGAKNVNCGNIFASVDMLAGAIGAIIAKGDTILTYADKCVHV